MAKKEKLSPDELLEQALVKEEDQPYTVPDNWVWVKFKTLAQDYNSFFDGDWILSENMDINGEVRLIQLSDIGICDFLDKSNKYISVEAFHKLNCREIYEGDLLISRMAEPIARSCILPNLNKKCITAVDVAVLRACDMLTINKFVNYLCNSEYFKISTEALARGTTRLRITRNNLGDIPIPLPPFPEQQRIVITIESLFEKLDRARELAQNAMDSFENRKSAILHKAFTGELTRKWREENGVDFERDWVGQELGKCGEWFGGGTPSKVNPQFWIEGNLLWVTPKDMKAVYIEDTEEKISEVALENSSAKLIPSTAVLFVVRSGILRRILPIAITTRAVTINQDMKAIIPKDINIKYFYWYCLANESDIRNKCAKNGTTVESINSQLLYKYKILLPPLQEQQEIVRILDNLLENEQKAKELCDVIDKIDHMKKSILARAFRGELGTNNPAEESALELLKEVLEAKV